MVDLLNPVGPLNERGPQVRQYEDDFYRAIIDDQDAGAATSATAQAIADYRQVLLNQLAALDDFIDEVEPSYATVGGIPTPDPVLAANLDPNDPSLNYLLDELPPGVDPVADKRGEFDTWDEAVSYIESATGGALFGIFWDDDLVAWVVYVVGSA